jgi:hypothetical protein
VAMDSSYTNLHHSAPTADGRRGLARRRRLAAAATPRRGRRSQVVGGVVRPARFERATHRFVARTGEGLDHHQDGLRSSEQSGQAAARMRRRLSSQAR